MFPHTQNADGIATLAAAIIQVRQKTDPQSLREAWQDAYWTVEKPIPTDTSYKEYQVRHGEQPTTPEEDQEVSAKRSEGVKKALSRLPGGIDGWMGR